MKFLSYLLMFFLLINSCKAEEKITEEKDFNIQFNGSFSNWFGYNKLNANDFQINGVTPSWQPDAKNYSNFAGYFDNNLGVDINLNFSSYIHIKVESVDFKTVQLKDLYLEFVPFEFFTFKFGNFDTVTDEYAIRGYSVGLGEDLSKLLNIDTDGFYAWNYNGGDYNLISLISDPKPDFKSNIENNNTFSFGLYLGNIKGLNAGIVYTPSQITSGINPKLDKTKDQYDVGIRYKDKIYIGVSSNDSFNDRSFNFGIKEDWRKFHLSFGGMIKPLSHNITLNENEYFYEKSLLLKGTIGIGFDFTNHLSTSYTYGIYYKKYDQDDYLISNDQLTASMKNKVFLSDTHEIAFAYKINDYTNVILSVFRINYTDPTVNYIESNGVDLTSLIENKALVKNQTGAAIGLRYVYKN